MEAKELRIGNYIGSLYEVKTLVKSINQDDDWDGGYFVITEKNKSAIRMLRPIPLTEEWHNRFKNEYVFQFYPDEDYVYIEIKEVFIKIHKDKVRYVHLWQNLYFALTGEELVINQKQ